MAGVGSVLPGESVAVTEKVCVPSARFVRPAGEVQELDVPESRMHRKVEPVSVEPKEKLADAEFDNDGGCDVIEVSGGAVSTVHVQVAGVASGPVALIDLTVNVCVPSATPASVRGEEHAE